MTDIQIVMSIMQNDSRGWRHICRNMRPGFCATLKRIFENEILDAEALQDIFQDSCMVLLENVKKGSYSVREGSSLFSYMVEIGKKTTMSYLRKNRRPTQQKNDQGDEEKQGNIISWLPQRGDKMQRFEPGKDYLPLETEEEKQKEQDEFLDRVFNSLPSECQTLLKRFYWDRKPMDEIASTMGLRNADSAKTKKNRCMNKFKEIARMLLESDEFAEEAVRAAAERAALRELLADERAYCEMTDVAIAAYQVDEKDQEDPSSEEQESNE